MAQDQEKTPQLNAVDLCIIVDHLYAVREAARVAKEKFAAAKRANRNSYTVEQYKYWKNVESGSKWAMNLAYQKAGFSHGRQSESIQ